MKLIDPKRLLSEVEFDKNGQIVSLSNLRLAMDRSEVEAEPVKHGHWVDDFCSFVCSVCGGRISDSTLDDYSEPRYCPNCGAKIDEVEGERK